MSPVTAETTIALVAGANQDYHVIVAGRNAEKIQRAAAELAESGLSVEPIILDVNYDESIAKAAQQVEEKYGRLDVLINNAGITQRYVDPQGKSRRMIMQAVFDMNVFGTYETTEAFSPLLARSTKTPRIVFISSSVGSLHLRTEPQTVTRATPFTEYPASKAALNMLCLHYAVKREKDGWKVNASCPGLCKTHLNGST